MYLRFHDRFGTAGVVLGVIAIVLAIGGSAIAASGLNGKQKKEVKAIAKSFQGTGPTGPAGAAGTNGTNGKDGAAGEKGKDGTNGTNGKSVEVGTAAPEPAHCEEGGATVQVAGEPATKKYVCNGKEGEPGEQGERGEDGETGFTETLPPGKTEQGVFAASARKDDTIFESGQFAVPISFNIPLAASVAGHVHYSTSPGFSSICTGTVTNPTAPSGELCIYQFTTTFENATFAGAGFGINGGTILEFEITTDPANVRGSWAVTG
jgi:hypothetical protein